MFFADFRKTSKSSSQNFENFQKSFVNGNWLKCILIDWKEFDKYNERIRTAPRCVFLEIF
ncbi:hypothetical protein T11_7587 [Trichinella zimbabwensis]|uniref:Uncharacterized protein n=1 Tax=Trichinella zimbabwensis TaxID=268475 RepID=A0A0V1H0D4_9BILA|nr:hypothetical protein T11_7587 [Trichinella zimbabwensis]